MRRFILFLLILLVAVWLGAEIAADPGYVLIAHQRWTMEMPIWVATVALLLTFFILYALIRTIQNTRMLPTRWRNWSYLRHHHRLQKLTTEGLLSLADGDWKHAQKKLARAAKYNHDTWFHHLAGAIACHEQQAFEQRDALLRKAQEKMPRAEVAIGLAQAKFLIQQQKFEQALATLKRLRQLAPKQNYILRLLVQLHTQLQDWDELWLLLPQLHSQKALPPEQLVELELLIYQQYLNKLAEKTDLATLETAWQQLPRHLRNTPALVASYAQLLLKYQADDVAEKLIRKALDNNWDKELIYCYGVLKSSKVHQQLATAESWLAGHEHDATLLLSLGRLSIANQLWGKARDYLQASIALMPLPETYLELGKLAEKLGEAPAAKDYYRAGLLKAAV